MVYTVDGVQYTRRKKIPVTGTSPGAQTNFQIKLTALWEKAMQTDYDDARFVKADMQTLIDAWLESKTDSTTADIWVEFLTTPADGVVKTEAYMYFGNAAVANYWDIAATFLFGDDFEDGDYTSDPTWSLDLGNAAMESGSPLSGNYSIKVYRSATQAGRISTPYGSGSGIRLDGKVKRIDANSRMWLILSDSGNNNILSVELSSQDSKIIASKRVSGSTTSSEVAWTPDAVVHDFALQWYNNNVTTVLDDVEKVSHAITDFSSLTDIFVDGSGSTSGVSGGYFDNIRVRKYSSTPPTAAFGTEEHQRRTPMMM